MASENPGATHKKKREKKHNLWCAGTSKDKNGKRSSFSLGGSTGPTFVSSLEIKKLFDHDGKKTKNSKMMTTPLARPTRGAQRDRDRERSAKEKEGGQKREGTGRAGVNKDAEALQKKIEEKKKLLEAGLYVEKAKPKTEKPKAMVNPHTGKADAEWTKKMLMKEGGKG